MERLRCVVSWNINSVDCDLVLRKMLGCDRYSIEAIEQAKLDSTEILFVTPRKQAFFICRNFGCYRKTLCDGQLFSIRVQRHIPLPSTKFKNAANTVQRVVKSLQHPVRQRAPSLNPEPNVSSNVAPIKLHQQYISSILDLVGDEILHLRELFDEYKEPASSLLSMQGIVPILEGLQRHEPESCHFLVDHATKLVNDAIQGEFIAVRKVPRGSKVGFLSFRDFVAFYVQMQTYYQHLREPECNDVSYTKQIIPSDAVALSDDDDTFEDNIKEIDSRMERCQEREASLPKSAPLPVVTIKTKVPSKLRKALSKMDLYGDGSEVLFDCLPKVFRDLWPSFQQTMQDLIEEYQKLFSSTDDMVNASIGIDKACRLYEHLRSKSMSAIPEVDAECPE